MHLYDIRIGIPPVSESSANTRSLDKKHLFDGIETMIGPRVLPSVAIVV